MPCKAQWTYILWAVRHRRGHGAPAARDEVCATMWVIEPDPVSGAFPSPPPPCSPRGCLQTGAGAPGGLSGTTWGNLIAALGLRRSQPGRCGERLVASVRGMVTAGGLDSRSYAASLRNVVRLAHTHARACAPRCIPAQALSLTCPVVHNSSILHPLGGFCGCGALRSGRPISSIYRRASRYANKHQTH